MPPSPRQRSADHSLVPSVNPDAPRSFARRDTGGRARHVEAGRDGFADSAGRRRVVSPLARRAHSPAQLDMAAIATAADRHLGAAACAEEQPRRDGVVLISSTGPLMTSAAITAILPRHACPGTVRRACRSKTCQLGSAPCLPLMLRSRRRQHQSPQSSTVVGTRPRCAPLMHGGKSPSRGAPFRLRMTLRSHARDETAPDLRGFRPPSTLDRAFDGLLHCCVLAPMAGYLYGRADRRRDHRTPPRRAA